LTEREKKFEPVKEKYEFLVDKQAESLEDYHCTVYEDKSDMELTTLIMLMATEIVSSWQLVGSWPDTVAVLHNPKMKCKGVGNDRITQLMDTYEKYFGEPQAEINSKTEMNNALGEFDKEFLEPLNQLTYLVMIRDSILIEPKFTKDGFQFGIDYVKADFYDLKSLEKTESLPFVGESSRYMLDWNKQEWDEKIQDNPDYFKENLYDNVQYGLLYELSELGKKQDDTAEKTEDGVSADLD